MPLQTRTDLWIFFHLPKTAGGTIFHSIRRGGRKNWPLPNRRAHFEPDEMPTPSTRILWQGNHVAYGLHALYSAAPNYVTVFREPCERLLSEFFYSSAQNNPEIYKPRQERLPAFIRFVEQAPHLNHYCHTLSAYCFEKEGNWDGTPAHAFAARCTDQTARLSRWPHRLGRLQPACRFHESIDHVERVPIRRGL
jgi:hypothetical protein